MKVKTKQIPLYSKIRDHVLENIHLNKWSGDDLLPTEAELAKQFKVSRFTVKKALSELVEQGLIYRIQGKGTFISPVMTEGDTQKTTSEHTTKLISLLLPHVQSSLSANILAGAEEVLSKEGYQIMYRATHNELTEEQHILKECIGLGIKGTIIFPVDGELYNEEILRLTLNKFPVVVIDRYLQGVDTNCVCSDNEGGAFEAANHLIELGHRKLGFICVHKRNTTSLKDRLTGYQKALSHHNIPYDLNNCLYQFQEENAIESIRSFFENNREVTAVLAATTDNGMKVLEAAELLGIQIPEQLSVICFDDYTYSTHSRTPPSCVVQQESRIGAEAAKLLLSVIENPMQERKKITLSTELILRKSTSEFIETCANHNISEI